MPGPLRVGGVPEAFNLPFERVDFETSGLTRGVEFVQYPGGSGAMLRGVQSGEVDVAFALTDCIVAAIENGQPVRLAGPVVVSSLTWAVVVSPSSSFKSVSDLKNAASIGISRLLSGSHVMMQVVAECEGWSTPPRFEVCGGFSGLREALRSGRIDAFLWEYYTTRPFEERGEVRIIGGVPTPWGCFSAVVSTDCGSKEDVRQMLDVFLKGAADFVVDPDSAKLVTEAYGMSSSDAQSWLSGVRYAGVGENRVATEVLELTRSTLRNAGVIREYKCDGGVESYCW